MTNKEIDLKIHRLLGLETKYDVLIDGRLYQDDLDLKMANLYIDNAVKEDGDDRNSFTIVSTRPRYYSTGAGLATEAAEEIAKKYGYTFVLTYINGEGWRAAFGDYKDCEEVVDDSLDRATCLAIIKFMENK